MTTMNWKNLVLSGLFTFAISFVVAAIVTYLWSLATVGAGAVDWKIAFVLAVALGFASPASHAATKKGGQDD